MIQDKKYLISEINEAFKDVKLEGGIGLSEANAIDDYKDEAFRTECRSVDEKIFGSTIPLVMLNQFNSSLRFF